MRILFSLSLVGRMSFMTLYHAAFVPPVTGDSARFFHTAGQSVFGHTVVTLISLDPNSILLMWCGVSYTRRLYTVMESVDPLSAKYAGSTVKRRR